MEALPRGLFQGYWTCLVPLKHQNLPAEKLGRIVENQGKTKGNQTFPFPVVPTRALLSSWGDNEGNIKEMGGKYTRTMLGDNPQGRNYSRGMGDARYPSQALKPD